MQEARITLLTRMRPHVKGLLRRDDGRTGVLNRTSHPQVYHSGDTPLGAASAEVACF